MIGFPAKRDSANGAEDCREAREKPSRRARYTFKSMELDPRQNCKPSYYFTTFYTTFSP
jgi:hypothetical protein